MVKHYLGQTHYICVTISLIINIFGCIFIEIFMSSQILLKIFEFWRFPISTWIGHIFAFSITSLTIILSLFKFKKLSFITYTAIFICCYICFVLLFQMKQYYNQLREPIEYFYFELNYDFFINFALAFYSFTNHGCLNNVLYELKHVNKLGVYTIINRSYYIPLILNCLVCFASQVSFGSDIPSLVIIRPSLPGSFDIFMLIAQAGIFFIILFSLVLETKVLGDIVLLYTSKLKLCISRLSISKNLLMKIITNSLIGYIAMILSFFVGDNIRVILSCVSSCTSPFCIIIYPGKF